MSTLPHERSELEKIQVAIFSASGRRNSENLKCEISLRAAPDTVAQQDIYDLLDSGLIKWDFNLKSALFMKSVSNPKHMVRCVAYYGPLSGHYKCLGYALGCINEENGSVEIDFIEKRADAPDELRSKFLPIIVDAYAAYALYLNSKDLGFKIDKFAFVNPVENKIDFYKKRGYEIVNDYLPDCRAAVKYLTQI